jgi:hypothetical protein
MRSIGRTAVIYLASSSILFDVWALENPGIRAHPEDCRVGTRRSSARTAEGCSVGEPSERQAVGDESLR